MPYTPVPYPKHLYHAKKGSQVVYSEQEEKDAGDGWVDHPDKLSKDDKPAASGEQPRIMPTSAVIQTQNPAQRPEDVFNPDGTFKDVASAPEPDAGDNDKKAKKGK